jgi:hypothetical protein
MADPRRSPEDIVTVDEVVRGKALVRFTELPQALHGEHPCFAPPVLAWERYRVSLRRNPYFDEGDAVLLLARRAGRPAGRIAAHVPWPGGEGRFGFWASIDDATVAAALVEAAKGWLEEQGCRSMVGPSSFEPEDEPGLLASGFEIPGTTGRPWQPASATRLLVELGFEVAGESATWRLAASELGPERAPVGDLPGQAGTYADPRLVLEGVAAVPDLSGALRTSGLGAAWGLARRAREGAWEGCTVVRCDDDPALAVPALVAAAGRAGYSWVVAPWSPDPGAPPESVHRTYRLSW